MINQIFDNLKSDVEADKTMVTSSGYAYSILVKLKFKTSDIHDLWMMVSDEAMFHLLEGDLKTYKKLNQFNSYLFFYLMIELSGKN